MESNYVLAGVEPYLHSINKGLNRMQLTRPENPWTCKIYSEKRSLMSLFRALLKGKFRLLMHRIFGDLSLVKRVYFGKPLTLPGNTIWMKKVVFYSFEPKKNNFYYSHLNFRWWNYLSQFKYYYQFRSNLFTYNIINTCFSVISVMY